jgi:hypothetical protein
LAVVGLSIGLFPKFIQLLSDTPGLPIVPYFGYDDSSFNLLFSDSSSAIFFLSIAGSFMFSFCRNARLAYALTPLPNPAPPADPNDV